MTKTTKKKKEARYYPKLPPLTDSIESFHHPSLSRKCLIRDEKVVLMNNDGYNINQSRKEIIKVLSTSNTFALSTEQTLPWRFRALLNATRATRSIWNRSINKPKHNCNNRYNMVYKIKEDYYRYRNKLSM